MPRRIAQPYRCPPLAQLARQLLFAPPEMRAEQVRRLESLHDQIDPQVEYPYEFLHYRVTGYRSEVSYPALLRGGEVLPDLRLMIDTLSRSILLPRVDEAEPLEELAARLKVSTKTIQRWRTLGLRWRWEAAGRGGRKRMVFPRVAVARFLAQHIDRVERAGRFTHISEEDRRRLIERARRLARASDASLNQVATHLARRTGRAVETIRQVLERHDAQRPREAIFADRGGPLTARDKRVMARAHRMGVPVSRIAARFDRSHSTIRRVLRERRAAVLRRVRIEYVGSPVFEREDADEVILRAQPRREAAEEARRDAAPARRAMPVEDLPEALRPAFDRPSLPAALQRSLLLRMNYLKFKAARLRDALDRDEPRVADMTRIEEWLRQAAEARRRVAQANLPIVLAVARQHLVARADRAAHHLLALLETGREVLITAIDEFDLARGQTFEAYLRWALLRRFAADQADATRAHRRIDEAELAERLRQSLAGLRQEEPGRS